MAENDEIELLGKVKKLLLSDYANAIDDSIELIDQAIAKRKEKPKNRKFSRKRGPTELTWEEKNPFDYRFQPNKKPCQTCGGSGLMITQPACTAPCPDCKKEETKT